MSDAFVRSWTLPRWLYATLTAGGWTAPLALFFLLGRDPEMASAYLLFLAVSGAAWRKETAGEQVRFGLSAAKGLVPGIAFAVGGAGLLGVMHLMSVRPFMSASTFVLIAACAATGLFFGGIRRIGVELARVPASVSAVD